MGGSGAFGGATGSELAGANPPLPPFVGPWAGSACPLPAFPFHVPVSGPREPDPRSQPEGNGPRGKDSDLDHRGGHVDESGLCAGIHVLRGRESKSTTTLTSGLAGMIAPQPSAHRASYRVPVRVRSFMPRPRCSAFVGSARVGWCRRATSESLANAGSPISRGWTGRTESTGQVPRLTRWHGASP